MIQSTSNQIPAFVPLVKAPAANAPGSSGVAGLDQDTLKISGSLPRPAAGEPSHIAKAVAPFVSSPLRQGNDVQLYVNGSQAYPEVFNQIDSAQKRLDLEFFTFHNDSTGQAIADKLVSKAKDGVQVNVLVDYLSNRHNQDVLGRLRDAGVNVREFTNGHSTPQLHLGDITDHRKILLVDGKTAMSGGMNLGERYQKYWHDFMTKVEGPSVQDYYGRFEHNWSLSKGSDLRPVTMDTSIKGKVAAQVAVTSPTEHEIKNAQLVAFKNAKSHIIANSPYFIDKDYVDALKAAAERGVHVTAVIPTVGDNPLVDLMNDDVTKDMQKSGVHVYRYDTLNHDIGKHDHVTDHFDHGKVATVDSVWTAIGTANADTRSMMHNQEIMALVDSPEFTRDLERRIFGTDIRTGVAAKASGELTGFKAMAAKALNHFRPMF